MSRECKSCPSVSKKGMLNAENGKKRAIKMTVEMKKLLSRTLKKLFSVWHRADGNEPGTCKISVLV